MTKREIIKTVLDGHTPPYVPWHCGFTQEPLAKLKAHLGTDDWESAIDNHFVKLGHWSRMLTHIGNERYQDPFGVVWDRSIEKDIGNIEGLVFPEPTLDGYTFPDPEADLYFSDIPERLEQYPDCYRLYCIGFSLFERAWSMRGMTNVLLDFYENPDFLHALLEAITDHNVARVKKALTYDIDGIYFGDDYGLQNGLITGPVLWKAFIQPCLKRMYDVVKESGKHLLIHSCGDIRTLLDDLVEMGVDCINPFQPEAMDVRECLTTFGGRASFHGGLSTQKTLPSGTPDDVRHETRRLLELGRNGSYIFAPAHAVVADTPLENILAFLEEIQNQPGYTA